MRWELVGAFVVVVGCGGRTELRGSTIASADAQASAPLATCQPGDATVVLTSLDPSHQLEAIATDGRYVYVAEVAQPPLWNVPASGGEPGVVFSSQTVPYSIGNLTTSDDGVYFDGSDAGWWVGHDGVDTKAVHPGVFAPPVVYWAPPQPNTIEIDVGSLIDGSSHQLVSLSTAGKAYAPTTYILVTNRFVHALAACGECAEDLRFQRSDGSMATPVEILGAMAMGGPPVSGPNAICFQPGCLLDEGTTIVSVGRVFALDERYAYARSGGAFQRVDLRQGTKDDLGPYDPRAVAVANGCIYVATSTQLVRIAAP